MVESVDTRDLLNASANRVGAAPTFSTKNPSVETPYEFESRWRHQQTIACELIKSVQKRSHTLRGNYDSAKYAGVLGIGIQTSLKN